MDITKLIQDKQGLFFIPNVTGYTRKDFKWLNSGHSSYEDNKGEFFYEAIKIVRGNVHYKKVYFTTEEGTKIIKRLN
jgi:hypothetical protein